MAVVGRVVKATEGLVGRGLDLGVLREAVDDARDGRCRFLLLSGEAGIGKTRLAREAAAYAASQGFTVLWASCWDGFGAPYAYGRDAAVVWIDIFLRAFPDLHHDVVAVSVVYGVFGWPAAS